MSAKKEFDIKDAKNVLVSAACLFSPVIIVFLEQAQTLEFNWKYLYAMAVGIILKTAQKYFEHNPK